MSDGYIVQQAADALAALPAQGPAPAPAAPLAGTVDPRALASAAQAAAIQGAAGLPVVNPSEIASDIAATLLDPKHPLKSATIRGLAILALSAAAPRLLALAGVTDDHHQAVADAIGLAGDFLGALWVLYGRMRATQPIG